MEKALLGVEDTLTLPQLVTRMQRVVLALEEDDALKHISPFARTYYFVTDAVNQTMLAPTPQRRFAAPDALASLDIKFAQLFYGPLQDFAAGLDAPEPWRTFYQYNQKDQGIPFVRMLLGINSHINGDLPLALLQADRQERLDFDLVNEVLVSVIPEVMRNLAFHEHDFWGMGALFARQLVLREFKHIVVRWRARAWENYELLHRTAQPLSQLRKIHQRTEDVGREIIAIFHDPHLLSKAFILERLEKLSV